MRILTEDCLRWVSGGLPASGAEGQTEFENGIMYIWSNGWQAMAESPEDVAAEYDIDIKEGADIDDISDNMLRAFDDIESAWDAYAGNIDPTITSGTDGEHSTNSLHYDGDALDLRTTAAGLSSGQIDDIADYLQSSLGSDYDVVVESDHIHIEYDPN